MSCLTALNTTDKNQDNEDDLIIPDSEEETVSDMAPMLAVGAYSDAYTLTKLNQ